MMSELEEEEEEEEWKRMEEEKDNKTNDDCDRSAGSWEGKIMYLFISRLFLMKTNYQEFAEGIS